MVKNPFKDLVIAISGDFGKDRTRKQLRQWIEVNGGQVSGTVTDDVTHLVCSEIDFKNNVDAVIAARDSNAPIVAYDWLEDSIMRKHTYATRNYEWANIIAKKEKQDKKRRKTESAKLNKDAKQDIFSGESDSFTASSMNRQVMNAFMSDIGTKKTNAKSDAAKARAAKAKTTPRAVKATALAKPRASRKRKADGNVCDVVEQEVEVIEYTAQQIEEAEIEAFIATTKPKGRGPVAFSKSGKAYYDVVVPTADPNLIIRAPTREQIQEGLLEDANRDFRFPDNYHVYREPQTGLDLAIMLVRVDPTKNNGGERIFLRLYESNTHPHTYAAYFRHNDAAGTTDRILAPLGSDFMFAFEKFTVTFRGYTTVDWNQRDKAGLKQGAMLKQAKKFVRSDGTEVVESPFIYLKNQPVDK